MADPTIELIPPLIQIYDALIAYFQENEVTANVVLGWKERTKQNNQGPGGANRVTLTPSDDNGKGGKLTTPRGPGPRPILDDDNNQVGTIRALRGWDQTVVVSVWAAPQTPHNERETFIAVVNLLEWTIRGINYAGLSGDLEWGDTTWTTTPNEVTYGREVRFNLTVRQPLYDLPQFLAHPEGIELTTDLSPDEDP